MRTARGLWVPDLLRPFIGETLSRRAIARGWQGLVRLAASVKHSWYPATEALDRFGSAAAGDPVFEAGDALGKLCAPSIFAGSSAIRGSGSKSSISSTRQGEAQPAARRLQRHDHREARALDGRTRRDFRGSRLARLHRHGTSIAGSSPSTNAGRVSRRGA